MDWWVDGVRDWCIDGLMVPCLSTNNSLKIIKNQGSKRSGGPWGEVWEPCWLPSELSSSKKCQNHVRGPLWDLWKLVGAKSPWIKLHVNFQYIKAFFKSSEKHSWVLKKSCDTKWERWVEGGCTPMVKNKTINNWLCAVRSHEQWTTDMSAQVLTLETLHFVP